MRTVSKSRASGKASSRIVIHQASNSADELFDSRYTGRVFNSRLSAELKAIPAWKAFGMRSRRTNFSVRISWGTTWLKPNCRASTAGSKERLGRYRNEGDSLRNWTKAVSNSESSAKQKEKTRNSRRKEEFGMKKTAAKMEQTPPARVYPSSRSAEASHRAIGGGFWVPIHSWDRSSSQQWRERLIADDQNRRLPRFALTRVVIRSCLLCLCS